MILQVQPWFNFTRLLIATEQGSVQAELYNEPQWFGCKAFIYSLWVEPAHRRHGVAASLLKRMEEEIAGRGYEEVVLEWDERDTPASILEWYHRLGYEDKAFDSRGEASLLRKSLKMGGG